MPTCKDHAIEYRGSVPGRKPGLEWLVLLCDGCGAVSIVSSEVTSR